MLPRTDDPRQTAALPSSERGVGRSAIQRRALSIGEPALLAAFTVLGLALRIRGLRTWWLNPDEGIYVSVATWPELSSAWAEILANAHPPLSFLLIRGLSALSLDVGLLRLPALLFGVAVIPALYLATRELGGRTAGLVAALAVAVSPSSVLLSQVVRPYTMQLALLALLLWCLARYLRSRRGADLAGVAVFALLASLVHYGSALSIAAMGSACLFLIVAGRLPLRDGLKLAAAALPAVLAMALLTFTHVSREILGSEVQASATEGWLRFAFHDGAAGVWRGFGGLFWYAFGAAGGLASLVLFFLGLGVAGARGSLFLASFAVSAVALAAVVSGVGLYPFAGTRHTYHLVLAIVPCASIGLAALLARRSGPRLALLAVVVGVAVLHGPIAAGLFPGAPLAARPETERTTPFPVAKAAEAALRESGARGSVVLLDRWAYRMLLPFFHGARPAAQDVPEADLMHFSWHGADVVVSDHKWLIGDARHVDEEAHVLRVLREMDAALPELALRQGRLLRVFVGGWKSGRLRGLHAAGRRNSPSTACVVDFVLREGFAWARLDPNGCLAPIPSARAPRRAGS